MIIIREYMRYSKRKNLKKRNTLWEGGEKGSGLDLGVRGLTNYLTTETTS